MKRSTLTSVFDRLEERGLISRETLAEDRRSFSVRLTSKGKTAANQVQRHVEALESAISKGIAKSDLEGFRRVMAAIAAATEPSDRTQPSPRTQPSNRTPSAHRPKEKRR
jgi:DNA-binding MarR family transcriptional regulator